MSSLEKSSKSSTPSQSKTEGSIMSEPREPEWWWHWGPESPKKFFSADHLQSFILTQKRNRNKSRQFPEPELYSGEVDADARKRMRLQGSYPENRIATSQTVSDLIVEIPAIPSSFQENPRPRNQMSKDVAGFKNGKSASVAQNSVKDEHASEIAQATAKDIQLLKRELELVYIHNAEKTSTLVQEIRHLQEENFAICEMLDWYKAQHKAKEDGSNSLDEMEELRAELERKAIEIEEKIKQNSSLEEQLNTAEGLSAVLKDSQATNNVSEKFSENLAQLEIAVSQAALLLLQCLSDKQLLKLRKNPCRKPELDALIKSSLGKMSIISSEPKLAFSALLFGFIRERVCYSTCWAGLQREGYMLKGYQAVIERITPKGTLEGFHRAALELMLEENHPFRDCWIQLHAEEAQSEFLKLFSPLLENSKFKSFDKDIQNALNRVFTEAFQFRAGCVPPRGIRYELIQFRAGDIFQPKYMSAQRPDGSDVSVPIGETRRVKICVHGCLVSHVVEEESLIPDSFNTIIQPFVSEKQGDGGIDSIARGVLKSGKAVVVLEDIGSDSP